jgi:hypothetical protein
LAGWWTEKEKSEKMEGHVGGGGEAHGVAAKKLAFETSGLFFSFPVIDDSKWLSNIDNTQWLAKSIVSHAEA